MVYAVTKLILQKRLNHLGSVFLSQEHDFMVNIFLKPGNKSLFDKFIVLAYWIILKLDYIFVEFVQYRRDFCKPVSMSVALCELVDWTKSYASPMRSERVWRHYAAMVCRQDKTTVNF
jgi:hypothetical protein